MDEIRITDLELYGHHGVLKEENILGQKFLISLVLRLDTRQAGRSDDIADSISYADVAHVVAEEMENTNFNLIEALAEHLAQTILLKFTKIDEIEVTVKKPWAPILLPLDTVSVSITRGWHDVYLSLGANQGDREKNIRTAIDKLESDELIELVSKSDMIETAPYGVTDQPDFINCCIHIRTLYTAHELLDRIHEIEAEGGRVRKTHWGPRTIDIDIIYYDHDIIDTPDLIVPHPDMHNREFVLRPLVQIAPNYRHPLLGKTNCKMIEELITEN